MPELWYGVVALFLTAYVVLDGFDLGAGALHLYVARTDTERRQVLAAIGPFWDGNEVCLLAAGGALFVAFPRVLSAGLSGFYFAIFLVLWSLMLRGIAIELRSHVTDPVWRSTWDLVFFAASLLLPVFFGAALGNLLRGVPLDHDGWFELSLFTDFSAKAPVGILDWYTVLIGVFALAALLFHGAAFLAWKTDGPVRERGLVLGWRLAFAVAGLWPLVTLGTIRVSPGFAPGLASRPLAWLFAAASVAGFAVAAHAFTRGAGRRAFLGSVAFLSGLSLATAAAVFPTMIRATPDDALSLTARNAAGDAAGLATAVGWLAIGLPLAVLYFVTIFRMHRGTAVAARDGEGY